jgi:Zn-dependent protease with chaperone function
VSFDPTLPDDSVNVSRTQPVREALVLVAGIAGMGAALFAAIALAVDLLVPRVPPRFEQWLFDVSWIPLVDVSEGDEEDPRAAAVSDLLERLSTHWTDCPYAFRVTILDAEEPNAMAFPGGMIAVTSGLLERAGSENELAFVLGHELGHYRSRDHLRGLGRGLAFSLVMSALGWSGGGSAQLFTFAGLLAGREFERDQEADADRFGLTLVEAEYGHVAGATDFFQRMPEPEHGVEQQIATYLATHPLNAERIEALARIAQERGWSQLGPTVPLATP